MNNTENQIVVYTGQMPVEYQNEIDALKSSYDNSMKIIATTCQERYIQERTSNLEEWYQAEIAKIKNKYNSILSTDSNISKEELNSTDILTTVVGESSEVSNSINTRDLDVTTYSNISMDEFQQRILKDSTEDYVPEFSLDNHIGYVKDLSVKAGFVAGSYVINSALTSIGLPPVTGLKYIVIGGIKIASVTTAAAINYGVQNPASTVAVIGNLPIAYTYAEKAIKKLKTKEEAPVTPTSTDTTVVPNPVVDKSIVESHSIYDFFELIGQITWKVLKKIESLF